MSKIKAKCQVKNPRYCQDCDEENCGVFIENGKIKRAGAYEVETFEPVIPISEVVKDLEKHLPLFENEPSYKKLFRKYKAKLKEGK